MIMDIPNQLKKCNKCNVEYIMEEIDEIKNELIIGDEMQSCFDFFEMLNQKDNLVFDNLANLNLMKVYKDIQITEMNVIENLVKSDKFIKNSINIVKELIESNILLEFGKKMKSSDKDIKQIGKLIQIIYLLGIFLVLNIYFFNEQRFENELRVIGSIMRNVLPYMFVNDLKSNYTELFMKVFFHCLESVKIIVSVGNIQEMCSTQVIMNLITVFSIEEISVKISILVIDIIVHIFITYSINSYTFMENTLNLILNIMEDIPRGFKSLKKARICIDLDFSIHHYVYLIIRIIQGICIPNNIVLTNDFDLNEKNSIKYHNLSKSICNHFSTFFIDRLIFNKVKGKDYHYSTGNDITVVIFSDLLSASLNPKYYICSTITNVILVQLIKISNSLLITNSNSRISSIQIDTYSKELCIYLLGVSLTIFLKGMNYGILLTGLSDSNNNNIKVSEYDVDIVNSKNEVNCICGNDPFNSISSDTFTCKGCNKIFHYNCITDNIYLEIDKDWKCDDCVVNAISNALNKNIGSYEGLISNSDHSNICIIIVIILDYLYRKTGLNTSPTKYETKIEDKKITIDVNSSIICSFILEMMSKLRLMYVSNKDDSSSDLKIKNENTEEKNEINKFFVMLNKEWFSPITNIHSSLVTYSSRFPKLLDSCTIRIWNNYLLKEIKTLSNILLHCLLANVYNSPSTTMKRIALNSLGQIISTKPGLLITNETIFNTILLSLKDKTPKIRERALVIIEKHFSDSYSMQLCENKCIFEEENKLILDQIIRTTFDISPLVRLASIKILRILYLKNPTKLYIGSLILKRALANDETLSIKRLSIDTFIALWFSSTSIVNEEMGQSLVDIINYSESKEFSNLITSVEYKGYNIFIGYIKTIIKRNTDAKSTENLITRWSKILIDLFLKYGNIDNSHELDEEDSTTTPFCDKKLKVLKSIEILGQFYPKSIMEIFPHIIVYLKDFSIIKSSIMINICTILSYILPLIKEINTKNIELDLLKIVMDSRSPQLIRSSILCLSNLLYNNPNNYVNENNILTPIIMESIKSLWENKNKINSGIDFSDIKLIDSIRRNAWLLSCIYEFNSPNIALIILNNKIERARVIETEFGISWTLYNNKISSENLNEQESKIDVDYNVTDSIDLIFNLICDLFYLLDWNLNKSILFPTLIQFLMNQKQFIKTIKFNNLVKSALKGTKVQENNANKSDLSINVEYGNDLNRESRSELCIICLQGILSLLRNFESKAIKESESNQSSDNLSNSAITSYSEIPSSEYYKLEDDIVGNKSYNTPNNRNNKTVRNDQTEPLSPVSSSTLSNIDNISTVKTNIFGSASHYITSSSAFQPLAYNLEILLSIFQEATSERESRFNKVQKQQVSSLILCILEHFNKNGIVNPTSIIPSISGLLFSTNKEISHKSYQILSSIFDKFPNLIINKYRDITINGFIYYYSNIKNVLGVYRKEDNSVASKCTFTNETDLQERTRSKLLGTTLEFFSRIYIEKCRRKRIYRESIINGYCKLLELLLSVDEVKALIDKFNFNINLDDMSLLILYIEFVSYLILALPFVYESELLLLLYNLGEMCVSCSQHCNSLHELNDIADSNAKIRTYSIAILAVTCTSLQKVLKEEYKVNENHISSFNPNNALNKEKPKYSHVDGEFSINMNEGTTYLISLNRNTIYEYMEGFREMLSNICELSTKEKSFESIIQLINETLYLNAHTANEKVTKPGRKKQVRKKNKKRSRDDTSSDTCSSQSWSPTKR